MKIYSTHHNHKQNFGIIAPKVFVETLENGLTSDYCKYETFFKNTKQLAQNLYKIGSKNTELSNPQINRKFITSSTNDKGILTDIFSFTLKAKNPAGKQTTQKFSLTTDNTGRDIAEDFHKIVNQFEQGIIDIYANKMAKRGMLYIAEDRVTKLFPNQKAYINNIVDSLSEKNMKMKTKLIMMSPWKRFIHYLLG